MQEVGIYCEISSNRTDRRYILEKVPFNDRVDNDLVRRVLLIWRFLTILAVLSIITACTKSYPKVNQPTPAAPPLFQVLTPASYALSSEVLAGVATTSNTSLPDHSCNGGVPLGLKFNKGDSVGQLNLLIGARGKIYLSGQIGVSDSQFGIWAFTSSCKVDLTFGHDGSEELDYGKDYGLNNIQLSSIDRFGRILLIATDNYGWVVGRIQENGLIDRSFGTNGFSTLQFPDATREGHVYEATVKPSGSIILAGDDGGGGCCDHWWISELTAQGQLDKSFGAGVWIGNVNLLESKLPLGPDNGITRIFPLADGSILVEATGGNMLVYNLKLIRITNRGLVDQSFSNNFENVWGKIVPLTFYGDTCVQPNHSFSIIGVGGKLNSTGIEIINTRGLVASFLKNGDLNSSQELGDVGTFGDPNFIPPNVFSQNSGNCVTTYVANLHNGYSFNFTMSNSIGKFVPSFGINGSATLFLPALLTGTKDSAIISSPQYYQDGNSLVILADMSPSGDEFELLRLII